MTGRSVIHHGIFTPYGSGDDASGLNLTYTLLPAHLKNEFGYRTYMVSVGGGGGGGGVSSWQPMM